MRLICPSCGAEYAVDDSVIPDTGRDVQCSGCSTTWFQEPNDGHHQAQEPLHSELSDAPESDILRETIKIAAMSSAMDENQTAKRQSLDSAVLDVLREEALREKAARAAETPPPPAPAPELEPAPKTPETTLSSSEDAPRIVTEDKDQATALAALSGRVANRSGAQLPDIEEINSTLRASADPARAAEEQSAETLEERRRQARKSFRMGFGVMVMIFLALTMLYLHGPKLSALVPELEAPVTRYISTVDTARRWLESTLRGTNSETGQ